MRTDTFIVHSQRRFSRHAGLASSKTLEYRQPNIAFASFTGIERHRSAGTLSLAVISAQKRPASAVRAIDRPENAYSTLLWGSALFGSPKLWRGVERTRILPSRQCAVATTARGENPSDRHRPVRAMARGGRQVLAARRRRAAARRMRRSSETMGRRF